MKTIRSLNKEKVSKIVSGVAILLDEALFLFGKRQELRDWQGCTGGYFCLADAETGLPFLIIPVGQVPVEKVGRYLSLCQEKAKRLAEHPEHQSSWESRNPDPEKDQWGGAVRVGDLIFSFSGLPETGDEALMLAVAGSYCVATDSYHVATPDKLTAIAAHSTNGRWEHFQKFLSQYA